MTNRNQPSDYGTRVKSGAGSAKESKESMERREENASPRARLGVEGLDDILYGGLLTNRLYLVEGRPGAGKTTLSLQFLAEGVRLGEKCVYITLSETREELEAGARSHGWTLDGVDVVELTSELTSLDGESQVTMYQPAEVELHETVARVLNAVERLDPARLVFDSLSELRLLAQSALRYRRQILSLKQFFVGRKCTVLMLDDKTADATDLQLQSIAHGVISLDQLVPAYGPERRRLCVLKYRGSDFRGGYHDYAIRRGGLEVFPRLVAGEHKPVALGERIESGVPALDALMGGGIDRGTSTLLLGPAGSGKSTVAVQYVSAAASKGERSAIFVFDESASTLRARSTALGIPLDGAIEAGLVALQQIDPAELSPGEFSSLVRRAVEVDGAKIIVIDSLNGYLQAMPDERFLTAQLHELLSYLARKGVAALMVVAQHGMMGAMMQTPVDTSYLADMVVLFRFFEHAGNVKKAISVVKKRSGKHEESIRELSMGPSGLALSEPLAQFRGVLTGVPWERSEGGGRPQEVGGDVAAR